MTENTNRIASIRVAAEHPLSPIHSTTGKIMNNAKKIARVTGAKSGVKMALRDDDGPTGSFTRLGETLPW